MKNRQSRHRLFFRGICLALAGLLISQGSFGQVNNSQSRASARPSNNSAPSNLKGTNLYSPTPSCGGSCNPRNGIKVGETKIFDDRSLSMKLQAIEANLAGFQFFDRASLAQAVGRLQGATEATSALAFSATTLPIPGVTTTSNAGTTSSLGRTFSDSYTTGATNSSGATNSTNTTNSTATTTGTAAPGTTTSSGNTIATGTTNNSGTTSGETVSRGRTSNEGATNSVATTITQAPISPIIPQLPGQTSAFSFQPNISVSAQDLLVEQENLTFQLLNLRTLLERALSDRIYTRSGKMGDRDVLYLGERPMVVVGFEISVDPQKQHQNAVAEAEITVTSAGASEAPSIVMQLPKEKTYNVAAITKDSKAFSLGAVVKVINVGFAGSKTRESLYVVKDTDTVSLERITPDEVSSSIPNSVTFGWQFRPVLGQKAVTPGKRQVYALLALPDDGDFSGFVEVHTRWRRYDAKSRTVGGVIDDSRNYQLLKKLSYPKTMADDGLKPLVTSVKWVDAGNNLVFVTVEGQNFLPGTQVLLGDTIIDGPANGLSVVGEHRLQFITLAQRLALATAPLILALHGPPQSLQDPAADLPESRAVQDYGIRIDDSRTELRTQDAQNSKVTLSLLSLKGKKPNLDNHKLVARVGNRIFMPGDPLFTIDASSADCVKVSFVVPTQQLRDARKITVRDFFWGEDFIAETSNIKLDDDFTATGVIVVATDNSKATQQFAITGSNFGDNVVVSVGGTPFRKGGPRPLQIEGSTLLLLSPTKEELTGVKQLIVTQGSARPLILPVSAPPAPLKKPTVDASSGMIRILVNNSKRIMIQGENLGSIKEVRTVDDLKLQCQPADDGKSMIVFVTSSVTKTVGEKDLSFVLQDGSVVPGITLVVEARPKT